MIRSMTLAALITLATVVSASANMIDFPPTLWPAPGIFSDGAEIVSLDTQGK
ncbi:hypothetical protein [Nioella nitratireducens]|uniref:hypothetical protein n=1 Tax=Nioella nitratireducens TaxID=1287720 RepID=UPI001313F35A|nr:hypothetical protein [Nioella nitratireducens]